MHFRLIDAIIGDAMPAGGTGEHIITGGNPHAGDPSGPMPFDFMEDVVDTVIDTIEDVTEPVETLFNRFSTWVVGEEWCEYCEGSGMMPGRVDCSYCDNYTPGNTGDKYKFECDSCNYEWSGSDYNTYMNQGTLHNCPSESP